MKLKDFAPPEGYIQGDPVVQPALDVYRDVPFKTVSSKWKLIKANGELYLFHVIRFGKGYAPHYEWEPNDRPVKLFGFGVNESDEQVADFVCYAHGGPGTKVERMD